MGTQSDGSRDIGPGETGSLMLTTPTCHSTIHDRATRWRYAPESFRKPNHRNRFNRNHRLNGEGGRIEAEWFVETVIDRGRPPALLG